MVELEEGETKLTDIRVVSIHFRQTNKAAHLVHGILELKSDPEKRALYRVDPSELVQVLQASEVVRAEVPCCLRFQGQYEETVLGLHVDESMD